MIEALTIELESWRGTPFTEMPIHRAQKGLRVNCVTFVEAVFVNLGWMRPIRWPRYVVSGGGEAMLKVLIDTLDGIPELELAWERSGDPLDLRLYECIAPRISPASATCFLPGDILLISSGRALHHLAIFAGDNTLWHATRLQGGVGTVSLAEPQVQKHLQRVYRPKRK